MKIKTIIKPTLTQLLIALLAFVLLVSIFGVPITRLATCMPCPAERAYCPPCPVYKEVVSPYAAFSESSVYLRWSYVYLGEIALSYVLACLFVLLVQKKVKKCR